MEVLQTKTDIGLIRDTNEDSVRAVSHPKNKNIKLLVVADGMGGKEQGDIASNYLADSLVKWFLNKKIRVLNDTIEVERLLKRYIKRINTTLCKKYGENHMGTTLTLALINRNHTIYLNAGDSRAYIYKDNQLIQVTEDDSDVWFYYKYGDVEKDDLRYFINNNLISSCVGLSLDLCRISTNIIENDYDMTLLFTDGVTDLITDKKIKQVIRRNKKEEVLDKLINEAVNVNQHLFVPIRLKRKTYSEYIVPFKGRDNASGAIFIKDSE